MTFNELKLRQLSQFLFEWEMKLRSKYKYEDKQDTTWEEVRDMYNEMRHEYLVIDLMDEEFTLLQEQDSQTHPL